MTKRRLMAWAAGVMVMGMTLSFLMFSGCTFLRGVVGLSTALKPKVSLARIEVARADWDTLDLVISLHVSNPNKFPLSLAKLTYQVEALGATLGSGAYADAFTVPAQATGEIRLPLKIDTNHALTLFKEMLSPNGSEIVATVKGQSEFGSSLGAVPVSFEDKRVMPRLGGR